MSDLSDPSDLSDRLQPSTFNWRFGAPALWVVGGVALVLRVGYVLQARANDPLFLAPQMDALYHHQWATAIANGVEFIHDAYFRAPLYPFLLGAIYKVFGPNLLAARLIQALIGSASCGLLYLLARRLFDEKVARISGLVMAFYPLAIYFDGELLIANLLVFLLLVGFVLFVRSRDLDRQWYLPGLAFGLAAIARPNVLAFIVALAIWLLLEYQARRWRRAIQFACAVAVMIAPVTIRNYVVSKRLVLIAWQGGTNFYIGNNPESDGITAVVPGTRKDWWGGYYDTRRLAEQAAGRELTGAEIDARWLKQGLRFWTEQPVKALGLLARKTYVWLAGLEISNNRSIYFFKRYSFLNYLLFRTGVLKFPLGLLTPLALVGLYFTRKRRRQLMPLYLFFLAFSASFVIFFVTSRYRMPVVVLAIPFAAYAVSRILAAVRAREGSSELRVAAGVFAGAYLLLNLNLAGIGRENPAQDYFMAAKGLYDRGDKARAGELIGQALARDSAVNVLSLAATIRGEQGQAARAEQLAQAAIRLWPSQADAWGLAGNVAVNLGQIEKAQSFFEQTLKLDPYSIQALNNLGNMAIGRNDLVAARGYYERALAIDPSATLPMFHLGLVNYYEGKKDEAHRRWRQVLQLEPNNAKARQALEQLK
jgi:4-amino-4-deoxy-L-arabinose transferase-like glycosyltransferase